MKPEFTCTLDACSTLNLSRFKGGIFGSNRCYVCTLKRVRQCDVVVNFVCYHISSLVFQLCCFTGPQISDFWAFAFPFPSLLGLAGSKAQPSYYNRASNF